MKMSVLYYTRTGHTKRMAEMIVEGMQTDGKAEASAFPLDAIDEAFVKESKCVVLGTPTYLATMAAPVKVWLDESSRKYALPGKIGGAFATEDYIHGGADIAIQAILGHFLVMGMMVYSGGGASGKPVIHFGPVALSANLPEYDEPFKLYGQRMAAKTLEILG